MTSRDGIAGARDAHMARLSRAAVDSGVAPGMQIVVARDGRVLEDVAAGFANLETRTAVTSTSVLRIGSLTKQVTGVLLLKLAGAGLLDLDAPAAKYLAPLRKQADFSLRELLHHTAGVHDDEEAPALTGEVTQVRLAEALAGREKFFDFAPGTAWLYSNANYILLGAVIESVTGTGLAQAFGKYIGAHAKLPRTTWDDPAQVVAGRASGYVRGESGQAFLNAPWEDVIQAGAAGGMRSTARELVELHRALLFGDLLTPSERAEFLAPAKLRDGRLSSANRFSENDRVRGDTQYGFGVNLDTGTRDASLIVAHNGFISGFSSYLATHVPSRTTVACLCNVNVGPDLPFRDVRRAVFGEFLEPPRG